MINNYNQLTIKQFLQCKTIAELEPDPITRKVKMLSSITGHPVDEIESLPITVLVRKLKEFSEIESLQPNSKVKMKFKVGGQRFECVWKLQELSASQYIELCEWTKDKEQIVYNIHKILASVCVKRTWFGRSKYNGDKHKEVADLFYNQMKIAQAYPIMLFFCRFFQELANNMLTYLEDQKDQLSISIHGGDGLQP